MNGYEKLLEKAEKELPEEMVKAERFVIEPVRGHIEGNKTILVNLRKIAKSLNREAEHLLKYLQRELATPGKFEGGRVVLGSKFSAGLINKKIRKYVGEYVVCPECGKPDTKLEVVKGMSFISCEACGGRKVVKRI